jgi:two-component sensor histidine kinase
MENKDSYRIVIAEDDVWVAREIRRLVSELGHEVVAEASNGAEAIKMVCAQRPDVVLMDIDMPEVDGIEASRIIQKTCPAPVVMLTAYETGDLLDRASSVGAGAYLVKPATTLEIERAVTIAVAGHGDLMRLMNTLEKEKTLAREIYHRVKNNLAMISTFLYLQAKASPDKKTADALNESESRIKTILLVHEMLHSGHNHSVIEFDRYLTSLAEDLHNSLLRGSDNVILDMDIDKVTFDSEMAIFCGLIVNELITNAAKHAFPDGRKGNIRLKAKGLGDGMFELSVSDNGIGLPEGFNHETAESFGMEIVNALVDQIDGRLEVASSGGTGFRVVFKEKNETV